MTEDSYILLVYKNLKGEISADEFDLLNITTAADSQLAITRFEIEEAWDVSGEENELVSESDSKTLFDNLVKANEKTIAEKVIKKNNLSEKPAKIFSLSRIISAIAAVLVLAFGAMFLMQNNTTSYNKAGIYTLADNSIVNLREGSSLKVNEFDNAQRKVELKGEAYFEIAKDVNRPFVVAGTHVKIEVLGTSFLVKESGDDTYIDLLEGKISTLDSRSLETKILTTGLKVHHTSDGKIISMPEYNNLSSWREGFYQYRDTKLGKVVEELSVIFSTKIIITNAELADCSFSGNLTGKSIEDLLNPIAKTYKMNFLQQESQWVLSNGTCN
jgi:ferric-dicitrate binding protein FerR (iron transport regulator)